MASSATRAQDELHVAASNLGDETYAMDMASVQGISTDLWPVTLLNPDRLLLVNDQQPCNSTSAQTTLEGAIHIPATT